MMKNVKIDGKNYPAVWNTRAKIGWEEESGMSWAELYGVRDDSGNWLKLPKQPNTKQSMMICYHALKEGHRLEGIKFNYTLEDVYEWNDKYDLDPQISEIVFPNEEDEKK